MGEQPAKSANDTSPLTWYAYAASLLEQRDKALVQVAALREEVSKLETERDAALEQAMKVPSLTQQLEVAHAFHKVACAERDAAVRALLLAKLAGDA